MAFIVAAVGAGVVVGLLRGGSVRNLGEVSFRWWPLLSAGAVLQVLVELAFRGALGFILVLLSYGLLLAFTLRNLPRPGMGIATIGIALNALVIGVNGGMPVRAEAIIAAGIVDTHREAARLDFGGKRHLERPDDRLTVLGDILPVPLGPGEVLSFGDLVLAVGVAVVLADAAVLRRRSADEAGEMPVEGAEGRPDGRLLE